MLFKQWLLNEINKNTILYHRSHDLLNAGDILTPTNEHGNEHWLKSKVTEKYIEEYRQQFAPDKPSRLDCVYCSVVPRSVFVSRRYLYEVKPIGKIHSTLAYIVNEIDNTFHNKIPSSFIFKKLGDNPSRSEIDELKWKYNKENLLDLFSQYWGDQNSSLFKKDPKWIEVLCEKVLVVKKAEEESDSVLRKGDKVVFKSDYTTDFWWYENTGKNLSLYEKKKILDDFKASNRNLSIPKGTRATIRNVSYKENMPNSLKNVWDAEHSYAKGDIHRMVQASPEGYNFSVGFYGNSTEFLLKIS